MQIRSRKGDRKRVDGKLPQSTNEAVNGGVERGMEQADLIKSCMDARGYRPAY